MSRLNRITMAALFSLLAALLLGGCGSGNREGGTQGGDPLFGGVATVGDTACNQCHSANAEALTGETLIAQYQLSSPHNVTGLGCESCHGGGAGHNGVGPIPFSLATFTPNQKGARCATCHDGVQTLTVNGVATVAPPTNSNTFEASNHATGTPSHTSGVCVRCHTHEGAVLSNESGYTGDGINVLGNPSFGPPLWPNPFTGIRCETCHQHGGGLRVVKARDNAGNVVLWDPDQDRQTSQFDLCTSCHNIYNYNKTAVIASGSAASGTLQFAQGPHNTRWNRVITTTHKEKGMSTLVQIPFANMSSAADAGNTRITGYVIRLTNSTDPSYRGPCYDCHGHEAKTNTGSTAPSADNATIHTDWAQSAHAGGLLTAKYAAGAGNLRTAAEVDAVTQAFTDDATGAGWTHYNWDDTASRGSCQACHTATGISNYLTTQNTALTGYDQANNDFSHLIGWSATGGSKRQNELLYCWGCHKDAGTGALRKTDQAILTFTFNEQPIVISGKGKSTACIVCHGGRGSVSDAILNDPTPSRSSRFQGHHAVTAGVMFSEQTHLAYEYPGLNYTSNAFVHGDIGVGANGSGPCASCHMAGKSHSFDALEHDTLGVVTAIKNQALCNTCHATGGLTSPIAPANIISLQAGYAQASQILSNYVLNVAGFANYLGYAINNSNYNNQVPTQPVGDNDYGAFQNAKLIGDEPCAYVHNSLYARRLLFDSIDWMDNGVLNGTITFDAVAFPEAAAWYGAPTGVATRP